MVNSMSARCSACNISRNLACTRASSALLGFPHLHSSKYTARSAGTGYCTRSSSFSAAKCCSTFVMPDVEMTLSQNTRERRREQQHRELGFLQPAASQVQVLQSA